MIISDTEPSLVTLRQTKELKKDHDKKVPNKVKPKRDGVINQQNKNFNQF